MLIRYVYVNDLICRDPARVEQALRSRTVGENEKNQAVAIPQQNPELNLIEILW